MFTSCTLLTYVSQNGSRISYRNCLYKPLIKKSNHHKKCDGCSCRAPLRRQLRSKLLLSTSTVLWWAADARIWLAAAILNVEKNSLAYRIVREGILSPNNNVAICALNALVEMNIVQAKSFIPQLRKAEAAWGENQGRPGVESMMLVARLRLEGKDFRFGSFW